MLTKSEIKTLKARAHKLNPVVIVGQHGLSDSVIAEISIALESHQLIKVRLNAEDREERAQMVAQIVQQCGCEHVTTIGHIGVFYLEQARD